MRLNLKSILWPLLFICASSFAADESSEDSQKDTSTPTENEKHSEEEGEERPQLDSFGASFERMLDQLDERFKSEFQRALEQMEKDREHIEKLLGEDMMGHFFRQLDNMAEEFGHDLRPRIDYEWEESENERVLVLDTTAEELKDFEIEISDSELTLTGTRSVTDEHGQFLREVEISQKISIPRDSDYTAPEYRPRENSLGIAFQKK